jgi:hypothetical protein
MTSSRATETPGTHSRWSRLAGNFALLVIGLVVSFLLCEIVLRLLNVSYPVYVWTDPVLGVAHIPGVKSRRLSEDGRPWIEINSDGMRGPEVEPKPPAGTFRIALLGDSFIEAFEVPYAKTVGEIVERRLSALRGTPVEVLNFAHGGYGTGQQLLVLQHDVWKYTPDLVLLAVTTGNDISDNYRPLKGSDYVPYFVYQGDRLVLDSSFLQAKEYRSRALWTRMLLGVVRHSRLAQLVNRARHLGRKDERQQRNADALPGDELGLRDMVHVPPATPEWQEAWRVTDGILRLMRDECRRRNTPFAVVTLTRGIQVSPVKDEKERFLRGLGAADMYYPERRISEFGASEGIPVLNLAPKMAVHAETKQVYFHANGSELGTGHWNEAGHEAAGELIASWLASRFPAGKTTVSRP